MLSQRAVSSRASFRVLLIPICAFVIALIGAASAHSAVSCEKDQDCEAVVAPCSREARCRDNVCEFNFMDEGEKCSYGDINGNREVDICLEEGVCDDDGLCISLRDYCPEIERDCAYTGDGGGDCYEQKCGDGICSGSETVRTCQGDCIGHRATCGDGLCETAFGEDSDKCPVDCSCGNGVCENQFGEYDGTCPADCLPPCNVNGICTLDEDSGTCAGDCVCGDKVCDSTEAANQSCPEDCSKCNGNNKCDEGENANSCREDCSCGDGVCDPFERNSGVCSEDCGGCDNGLCNVPLATAVCQQGGCVISNCDTGYGDCDLSYPNGCEVEIRADEENCGSCGNDCTSAPRVDEAFCAGSKCGIAMCDSGFDDCDGEATNGCEANLRNVATCGSCNNDCRDLNNVAQSSCGTGGRCGIVSCDSGFSNCDGITSNGCETAGQCARCGDGNVDAGEACDDGDGNGNTGNGSTTCGCQNDCQYSGMLVTCDDQNFCNGLDLCDGAGTCATSGESPCTNPSFPICDEDGARCLQCAQTSDCEPASACEGGVTCATGAPTPFCLYGSPVSCGQNEECVDPSGDCECADGFVRDGPGGACIAACTGDGACDDGNPCTDDTCSAGLCSSSVAEGRSCEDNGLFCDGPGVCSASGSCVESGSPCSGGAPVCDESNNDCVECLNTSDCGGGLLCDTQSRTCVECLSATDCPVPGNECLVRTCETSNVCGVLRRDVGATCATNGDACDGAETCQNDGSDFTCQSTGVDPCAADPANPACTATGTDQFECNSECGDGLIGFDEACDLGDAGNSDDPQASGCSTSCTLNTGWRCAGGADSCVEDDLEAICGDSIVIASEEACDEGTEDNGSTTCGCTGTCEFRAVATPCSDGQFCTVNEECNGAGSCVAGQGSPCGLGPDACREDADTCDACLNDANCDNGSPCDGVETCDLGSGTCNAGTSVICTGELACNEQSGACVCPGGEIQVSPGVCEPSACTADDGCDDGDACNGEETCNTDIEQCVSGQPLVCADSLACNGTETCNASSGCVAGTPVACGTGSECVEPSGTCDALCGNGDVDPGEECDDGIGNNSDIEPDSCRTNCVYAFCGDDVIDVGEGEQCDDGNTVSGDGCSVNCLDEECTVATVNDDCTDVGICQRADCVGGACFYNDLQRGATTDECNADGEYCNGDEICSGSGTCTATGDPCLVTPQLSCSEALDDCVTCLIDDDCADGVFCNGVETCDSDGGCQSGANVDCGLASICVEANSQCESTCGNGICNAGETSTTCPADCDDGEGDTDGDGIPDVVEDQLGTLPGEKDSDGDGVPDDVEVFDVNDPLNTDGDGLINALDPDDDGDGIDTVDEDINGNGDPTDDDTDDDGIPNYLDDDDDGDRIPSEIEAFAASTAIGRKQVGGLLDSDEDEIPNYLDNDDDNDTVLTADEVPQSNDSPWLEDTDDDGLPNYIDTDDDGDGLLTSVEVNDFAPDFDGDGIPNHLDVDDDDDDVLTASELTVYSSNPYKEDTDDDLLLDGDEVALGTTLTDNDTDDDLLLDGDEVRLNADPLDSDTDDDGLLDGEEVYEHRTGVRNPDTDDDFLLDGDEIDPWGTDPLDSDTDDDGILDGIEVQNGTDPNDPNSGPETGGEASGGCQSTGAAGLTWFASILGLMSLLLLSRRARARSREV